MSIGIIFFISFIIFSTHILVGRRGTSPSASSNLDLHQGHDGSEGHVAEDPTSKVWSAMLAHVCVIVLVLSVSSERGGLFILAALIALALLVRHINRLIENNRDN